MMIPVCLVLAKSILSSWMSCTNTFYTSYSSEDFSWTSVQWNLFTTSCTPFPVAASITSIISFATNRSSTLICFSMSSSAHFTFRSTFPSLSYTSNTCDLRPSRCNVDWMITWIILQFCFIHSTFFLIKVFNASLLPVSWHIYKIYKKPFCLCIISILIESSLAFIWCGVHMILSWRISLCLSMYSTKPNMTTGVFKRVSDFSDWMKPVIC